ncbi:MAG TPA: M48 family metalloprotease [Pseudonocardiaceae bacterium]|jgi:Zn-dependent protease with chaperone function/LysM repeat protein|nr:M48 family metalloprotease [Pseudonocardiaceae bacterium]
MTTLRGLLAVALLTGVYLVAAGSALLLGGMIVGGAWLMYAYASGRIDSPAAAIPLLLGSVPVLMAILAGLFAVRRAARPRPAAIPVGPAEAPKLWRLVDELAEQIGTAAPAEILLTAEVNAAVTENTRLLGLLPGHRCLYLGIPLLAGLTRPELRALLGHELGHYAGKHTRLTALIYRGYLAMDGIAENLRPTRLSHRLCSAYANTYARLSYAMRRRQELEADRTAVRLAGRAAAADALRAVYALRPIWQEFENNYLRPAMEAGRLPADPVAAFAALLKTPDCRDALCEYRETDPPARPFDSHPGLAARLRNLDRCTDIEPPAEPTGRPPSAWPWTDLGGLFIDDLDRVQLVGVPSWLRLVARLRAPNAPTNELLAAAWELTRGEPTIGTVLELLAAGRSEELAATLTGEADEAQAMARLCESLFRVLAHALVSAGCGHWRLCWARPSELVIDELSLSGVRSTDSGQLAEAVFSAVERPTEVDRLRFHLITLGFNPDARLTVEPVEPRRLLVRPRVVDQLGRDRRNVLASGVIGLAVAAVVLLFGFGQRASMTPPSTPTQYTVAPTNVDRPLPGPPTALVPPHPLSGPAQPPGQPGTHQPLDLTSTIIVRAGQTLPGIATCYGTTVAQLQQENDLGDSTRIHLGETLIVPLQLAPPRC